MTLNFDGGDILVIILVSIALFLIRRFDKTNRSLEKVKLYARNTIRELDNLVISKETRVKDLLVDFNAQEKTNKEILSRVEVARNEIISRTDKLDEQVERIKIQERALDDLNELAFKVDENLSRLKDESTYIDEVGTRLSDIHEKFSTLEKNDEIRFVEFKKKALATFQVNMKKMHTNIEETNRQLRLYKETVENLNAQQDEAIIIKQEQYQDNLEQVEAVFRERLKKIAEEGIRLEDDAFMALNEKIDSRTTLLEQNWFGGLKALQEEVTTTTSNIQTELSETHRYMDISEKRYQEFEERIENKSDILDTNLNELDGRIVSRSDILDTSLNKLNDRVESALKNLAVSLKDRIQSTSVNFEAGMKELDNRIVSKSDILDTSLKELDNRMESTLKDLTASLNDRIQSASVNFETEIKDLEEHLGNKSDTLDTSLEELDNRLVSKSDILDTNLKELDNRMVSALKKLAASLNDQIQSASVNFDTEMKMLEEHLGNKSDTLDTSLEELDNRIVSKSDILDTNLKELDNRMESTLKNLAISLNERIQSTSVNFETEINELEERLQADSNILNNCLEELKIRVTQFVEIKETNLLETIETHQNEYKLDIENRFVQIEGFIDDMDILANSLRSSQKQTLKDIAEVFQQFDSELQERRELEKAGIEEEAARVRQEMTELEHGLEELKARAYENVSEKLQVFENGFIADLKDRDDQMKITLEEWHKSNELELTELGLQTGRDREATEQRYSAELKQKFSELQSHTMSQFENFQDQVNGFRDSLTEHLNVSEESLASYRQDISDRIAGEKEAVFAEFEKSFVIFDSETEEKFTKAGKTISQKLTMLSQEIDVRRKGLTGEFHSFRDETVKWMDRINVQVTEAENGTNDTIETMKFAFAGKISELQEEYASRTEQLILDSSEDRGVLRRQIAEIKESVNNLASELSEKNRETLIVLTDQRESCLLEFRKQSREAREEVERKVRELRQSVQDSRDKIDIHRKEILDQVDSEYNRLIHNLDEIDTHQKEFIAETQVFDRADTLKISLESDIAELGRQLDSMNLNSEEVQRINNQYEHAMNLYKEVSGKMSRFLSEQQKVDNLEEKINRFWSLARSVDHKMSNMNDTYDKLQNFQVRLKQLEDIHEDIDNRYKRLSDKSTVLDTATEGVDKSFQRMMQIENMVKELGENLIPLKEDMGKTKALQVRLIDNTEKVDLAVNRIQSLDSTIQELDNRLEEMGKAREWLARTETRLEQINTETQQHIKLLGTLTTKRDSRSSSGSPDMSMREMVVKLARQGWNSEEISRTVKLSRGEVELILELTPNEE